MIYLDYQVRSKFEGARWELPSRVYAQPTDLFAGKQLSKAEFLKLLELLRYKVSITDAPGHYRVRRNSVYFTTREFQFPDETVPSTRLRIDFNHRKIFKVANVDTRSVVDIWRLEPVFIGGIYPQRREDRVLVKLEDVPNSLIRTLLAVEDRNFYNHYGVAPLSILRAIVANIKAGSKVQGGSTLTQQLVKNFYLSGVKTFSRKIREALMALLLEFHYSKDEILEAYLNEVYLGQDGKRAIHGFGLAAPFYFDKSLEELNDAEIALLVGMVKGASYYDPRRHPQRAMARRQVVQKLQLSEGVISEKVYRIDLQRPLGVTRNKPSGTSPYPYFLELVKKQLLQDYAPEDLQTAGLRLFTTLDPLVQDQAEKSVSQILDTLPVKSRARKKLDVASLITDPGTGKVQALIGGKNLRNNAFNRALASQRQIGSLVKPFVYLTALQQDDKYRLNTLLPDSPISIDLGDGSKWQPENYDKKYHGDISLRSALANSFNVATVRLGLSLGLEEVIQNIHYLGVETPIKAYPSSLLGAMTLSPYEVTQLYQTLASQGFKTPLRAINTVTTGDGKVLSQYPITVQKVIEPMHAYLILNAMQSVVQDGTASAMKYYLRQNLQVAGKTGTTNDYRDSWFAGITGDKLAVVWVGADDNSPTGLTGASGAMKIWANIIKNTNSRPLDLIAPSTVKFIKANMLDYDNG
ncbi:MAG: penicillin-binding protein 1B, partial [Gammaproteobacteria bacterium]|nr:penicillin-binding protein 1B [Gammaproteobacteria bacterium]